MSHSSVYDLKSVKLPRLGGAALKLVVTLAEHSLTRPLIVPQLLESSGVAAMRDLKIAEPLTFLPVGPADHVVKTYTPPDLNAVPSLPPVPHDRFRFWSVRDFCSAYGSGQRTPEEVAQRVIDAIAESDRFHPAMRMFIASYSDDVMRQARASTERWTACRWQSKTRSTCCRTPPRSALASGTPSLPRMRPLSPGCALPGRC